MKYILSTVIFFITFFPSFARAAEKSFLRIYNAQDFSLKNEWRPQEGNGFNLATIDLGGDGVREILAGAGFGERPAVKIFRGDGSLINEFLVYNKNFRGGVRVAAGDFDGDGREEIVAGAGFGGGPQVRIFDGFGRPKFTPGFFVFNKSWRGGISVAVGDFDGDGKKEIAAGSPRGKQPEVKIVNIYGNNLGGFKPPELFGGAELKLSAADLNNDGKDELIVSGGFGSTPQVFIFNSEGKELAGFYAYAENFRGGINTSAVDLNGDGRSEIITGAGWSGGPQLRIFSIKSVGAGYALSLWGQFMADDKSFRGGQKVATGDIDGDGEIEIITAPDRLGIKGGRYFYKYIDIDLSEQKFRHYEDGYLLGEYLTSTGKPSTPTPMGNFKIIRKLEKRHLPRWSIYMNWWMQFAPKGVGVHAPPYWIINGALRQEGNKNLGRPVSHGSVRLAEPLARKLYQWAEIGTPVFVRE